MAEVKSKSKAVAKEVHQDMGGELIVKLKKPELSQPQSFSVFRDDQGIIHQYMDANGRPSQIVFNDPVTKLMYSNPNHKRKIDFMLLYSKSKIWMKRGQGIELINNLDEAKTKNEARMQRSLAEAGILEYFNEGKDKELGHLLNIFTKTRNANLDGEVLRFEIYKVLDRQAARGSKNSGVTEVIGLINNPNKDKIVVFNKGLLNKVFENRNNLFYYNTMPMGRTADECVLWFVDNADLYALIKAQIDELP